MPTRAPISFHFDLYHYWLAKRGDRAMPARKDINPAEIPVLLPYLVIVDKAEDRFRYRLVGTAVVEQFGHDFTRAAARLDTDGKIAPFLQFS